MKHNILSLLIICSLALVACISCSDAHKNAITDTNKNNDVSSAVNNFEITQVVKTAQRNYICSGDEAMLGDSMPVYSVSTVAIQWPEKLGNYDIKLLQDSLKMMAFGAEKGNIDDIIVSSLDHPQGEELYDMTRVDSIPYNKECMVLYKTVISSAVAFSPQFIVYQVMTSMYDGGAHGISLSRYITYLFNSNRILDIPTAFRQGSEEGLLQAIRDQLMTQYGATSLDELNNNGIFTDQLYVSPNFYIHGYDIVFHYNPYDIAAFSEGNIDVSVPYQALAEYLTPEMLSIMERTGV